MKNVICVLALMMVSVLLRGQIINFPDVNFKNALVNSWCVDIYGDGTGDKDADENNDGEIDMAEAIKINNLHISGRQISQLKGIEYFDSLQIIECSSNQLSELIISNLTALRVLDCRKNQLSQLTISNLPSLHSLYCNNNQLTQLTF